MTKRIATARNPSISVRKSDCLSRCWASVATWVASLASPTASSRDAARCSSQEEFDAELADERFRRTSARSAAAADVRGSFRAAAAQTQFCDSCADGVHSAACGQWQVQVENAALGDRVAQAAIAGELRRRAQQQATH